MTKTRIYKRKGHWIVHHPFYEYKIELDTLGDALSVALILYETKF